MTWTEDTIASGSQRVTGTTGGVRVPVALTGLPVDGICPSASRRSEVDLIGDTGHSCIDPRTAAART